MTRSEEVLFSPQAEARVPAIVAQRHDSHSIEFFVEQQVIGEFFKIAAPPTTEWGQSIRINTF